MSRTSSTSVTPARRCARVSTGQRAGAPADAATVRCGIMTSSVSDALGRYHYAKQLRAGGQPYAPLVDEVLPCHDAYWQSEDAMAEGCPALALERGEKVQLPPVLYLQGTEDLAHPRPHLDRFVAAYRRAGGVLDLELFEGEGESGRCRRGRGRADHDGPPWCRDARSVEHAPQVCLRLQGGQAGSPARLAGRA